MNDEVLDFEEKDIAVEERLASKGQRFGNYVVDIIFFYILSAILGVVIALFDLVDLMENELALQVILIFVMLLYYLLFEFFTGKTIGKYITKTRVVTEAGNKPNFGQCLGRTFSRLVPFEAFSLLGEKGIGWHDSWAKTRVIKE